MFSEVFFTGLYSSLIGFLLAMGAQCYKSKCSEVKICCITIHRDVAGEEQLTDNHHLTLYNQIIIYKSNLASLYACICFSLNLLICSK